MIRLWKKTIREADLLSVLPCWFMCSEKEGVVIFSALHILSMVRIWKPMYFVYTLAQMTERERERERQRERETERDRETERETETETERQRA